MTDKLKEIWIVDDDVDDQDLIMDIFEELHLEFKLQLFETGEDFMARLKEVSQPPFIVIATIKLPKIDGFTLREEMLSHSSEKFHSVPFIFWATHASHAQIKRAYDLKAHGFFQKAAAFEEWKATFRKIISYWSSNLTP
jgi:DNA-binding NtrC family response regulator